MTCLRLFSVALLLSEVLLAQDTLPISIGSHSTPRVVAGNAIYYCAEGRNREPRIYRWEANQASSINPFAIVPGEIVQLLALYGDKSGEVFVAYNKRSSNRPQVAAVGRVDFNNSRVEDILVDSRLFPRSIAVGTTAYYLFGLTRDEERMRAALTTESTMNVRLLHLLAPTGDEIGALFPVSITATTSQFVSSLLHRAQISLRRNGNFFVVFEPFLATAAGWTYLVGPDLTEYSPQGDIVKTHRFGSVSTGQVVSSVIVEEDDSLTVQLVKFSSGQSNHPGSVSTFHVGGTSAFHIPSGGQPKPILQGLLQRERIMGKLASGKIVTEPFSQGFIRTLTP